MSDRARGVEWEPLLISFERGPEKTNEVVSAKDISFWIAFYLQGTCGKTPRHAIRHPLEVSVQAFQKKRAAVHGACGWTPRLGVCLLFFVFDRNHVSVLSFHVVYRAFILYWVSFFDNSSDLCDFVPLGSPSTSALGIGEGQSVQRWIGLLPWESSHVRGWWVDQGNVLVNCGEGERGARFVVRERSACHLDQESPPRTALEWVMLERSDWSGFSWRKGALKDDSVQQGLSIGSRRGRIVSPPRSCAMPVIGCRRSQAVWCDAREVLTPMNLKRCALGVSSRGTATTRAVWQARPAWLFVSLCFASRPQVRSE